MVLSARTATPGVTGCSMLGWLWVLSMASPEPAAAIEPPSGQALEELRARSYHELRVVGTFGARTMHEPIVSEQGVTETRPPSMSRVALIEGPGAHPKDPPPLVTWSEISEVQAQKPAYGAGVIVGVTSGLLVGLWLGYAVSMESDSYGPKVGAIAVATGVTAGALTTVLFRGWKQIYPKKS